ncbi:MAG: amidase family protein [Oscillospiraceae bacterium]|nr:amidase family protein [Oscillospiraceae bacterium]
MDYFIDDSIMQKGRPATAGSKMLANFISPLDATVVTRLKTLANTEIHSKSGTDEFGASALTLEPSDNLPAAVEAVKNGTASIAICNDYTGSVRLAAAANGLSYIHPTYGTVSRFGLIPAASSMDQIGVVCNSLSDGFSALEAIAGANPKDGAMFPDERYSYQPGKSGIKIGVPAHAAKDPAVSEFVKNFDSVEFELKYFDVYSHVMLILCFAELCHNINRYDGIKFGHRAENFQGLDGLYVKSRTEAFGFSAKLAAIMGAFVLSGENYTLYYDKAMRIRRLIKESLDFGKYDAIILPAHSENDPLTRLAYTALPQLAGLPSVTVPFGGGISLIADVKRENTLFSAIKEAGL